MGLKKEYEHEFERVWREYPNKANKLAAYKSWIKHIDPEDREELRLHVIERARLDDQWSRGYVPHLATFINGARWEDDYRRVKKEVGHRSWAPVDSEVPEWVKRGMSEEEYRARAEAAKDRAMRELRMH